MSNIHAAIGLAQTYSLKDILNKRKEIYKFYKENLKLVPGVKLLGQSKGSIPNYWLNVIQIDKKKYGKSKNGLINYFLSKNIQVRSVWYPNHMQKPFLKNQSFLVKNSLKLFKESICLPSSHSLSKNQLRFIISTIKKYAKK